jgi:DNA-directed RNA polymerase specialized sigma24 family protein
MGSAIKTLLVSQSDEKLLELAQHGCEVAFQTLTRRYRRPLLRHCRQLCLLEDQAQEVLQRTLTEARNGLQGQTQPVELAPWLRQIAQAMASEAIGPADSAPAQLGDGLAAEPAPSFDTSLSDGAPRLEEVLALRGALAAISPLPQRSQVFMHGRNGNKSQQPVEDAFDLANSAVHALLGRARRGISALTPPPLLAWLASRAVQSGAGSERMLELGGGGAAGLTGLAVKGGIAALTAGVAITGAVIATSRHQHGAPAGHRVVAASGAGTGSADGVGGSGLEGAGSGYGAAASSGSGHRHQTRTQRSRAHLHGGSSLALTRPTNGSTGASHGSSSHSAAGGAPASSPAASAPQASGAAEHSSAGGGQPAGGGAGTEASGGGGSATPPQGSSGQPSGTGEQSGSGGSSKGGGIGVQVSVETGSGSQSSSSESGGSASGGSQSGGTGVGVSISLEPVGSVGVHISLP